MALHLQIKVSVFAESTRDIMCPFALPCICIDVDKVNCSHKGLSSVPPIKNNLTETQWNIDLSYNNLTAIMDGTFGNLSLQSLSLDHNQIYAIGDNLLNDSKNSLFTLNLHFNRLTYLPITIGKLRQLSTLKIHGNPIMKFNEDILQNISTTLDTISYGSPLLKRWPYEMKRLSNADWITIYGIDIETLPVDAFDNLFLLNITGSTMKSISGTLSNSTEFFQLILQDNRHLTASGLANGGFKNIPQFRTLYIINCGLDTLPPIFDDLTYLDFILLDGNPIKYIADDTFPRNYTSMIHLTIQHSLLQTVPATLSHLTRLEALFLNDNKINSISESDFLGMSTLYRLDLSNNPITKVSDSAFKVLTRLGYLFLKNTTLTTIPKAIKNNHDLNTLDMSNSPVECTCSGLGWMKDWDGKKHVGVIGNCGNQNQSIANFIAKEIPKCA